MLFRSRPVRARLLVLASEKNVAGYERVARLVDGDAYYWSSVNPSTYPDYPGKLDAMAEAVHARRGLWIAPAAPGFDARLLGGKTVVPRENGRTFVRELRTAVSSGPDAIGVISWNEYSENSQIEPSTSFGYRYLQVLADYRHEAVRFPSTVDSSASPSTGTSYGLPLVGGVLALALLGAVPLSRRRGRHAAMRAVSGRRPTRSP